MTTLSGAALGTTWQIRFSAPAAFVDRSLHAAIVARLDAIAADMSQWRADSRLSAFNRAPAGTWLSLSPDFATVIDAALAIAARTGGAFDPTLGRAAALLGYGAPSVARPPTAAAMAAALADARDTAGWHRLHFDRGARRLRQPGELWLDFSGIGKGYAVDAVAQLLHGHGIEDALVEIGGELVGRGLKPDGQPWWVDLETPPGTVAPPLRLALHDMAVATSGDYVRGAHTLDPGTGHPLPPTLVAVSVLHPSAMHADALATALTVLGADAGLALATADGLPARFLRRQGDNVQETLSPALQAMLAD